MKDPTYIRSVAIRLSEQQLLYCQNQNRNLSEFIRQLINRSMDEKGVQ